MSSRPGFMRRAPGRVASAWRAIGLRWQLMALNAIVIAAAVAVIIVLMHNIAQQQFMSIMHAAGQPVDPAAGQRAYDAAVEAQIYPTIAVAAVIAVILNFVFVTIALRPLSAVRDATRRLARGDTPEPVATRRRDEIGDVAISVNELAESLQMLEDLRRQVTNDVAHELRTPLHNLLGLIEGMRDGVIPASPAQMERARAELGRLIALVEDLRALADAQLARDRMSREPLDLVGLARDVMAGFEPEMGRRGVTWTMQVPPGRCTVDGDPGRMAQVLRNIVDNAVRYARAGTEISLAVVPRDGYVRVAVHDTGETIDAEALPHIFERFFRADPSRARGSGGAGVGLAIVKELAEAHGGAVGANGDDDGVTVWFEVPLHAPDAPGTPAASPPAQAVGRTAPSAT